VLKNDQQNHLDLHKGKDLSHARMHATTKAQTGRRKSVGIKGIGIVKGCVKSHGNGGRDDDQIILGNLVGFAILRRDFGILRGLAQQHDETPS
jgi:hypothetical protein